MPTHQPHWEREAVRAGVDPDGWAIYEPSPNTTITCACGLNTGSIPTTEARRIYREHRDS